MGIATARALLSEGASVTICSRSAEDVSAAADRLRGLGPAAGVMADVSVRADVERLSADVGDLETFASVVDADRARLGRQDVLVDTAGVGLDARIEQQSDRRIDQRSSVDLRAVITGYRLCLDLPHGACRARCGGRRLAPSCR